MLQTGADADARASFLRARQQVGGSGNFRLPELITMERRARPDVP